METASNQNVAEAANVDIDTNADAHADAPTPKASSPNSNSSISTPHSTTTATPSSTNKPKRKSMSAISKIKVSDISKKVPSYLSRSTKGSITYFTLVHEAIVDLADRTGSSVPAIEKYIKGKHDELKDAKPKMLHNGILAAVKGAIKDGKLVKVRCSYKINRDWVQKEKKIYQAKEAKKKVAEKKRKKDAEESRKKKMMMIMAKKEVRLSASAAVGIAVKEEKIEDKKEGKLDMKVEAEFQKRMEAAETEEDRQKVVEEKKQAREANEAKKEALAKKAKEREDRIKKRRFPMEDLKLICEDKELCVKKSSDVTRPPFLPFVFQSLMPHDERPKTKKSTPGSMVNACSTTVSTGSRGLISDVLQVYHFFVGDIGYARMSGAVPNFTLKHLLHAVNEIVSGNARKSRAVPPLISQLFVAALTVLTSAKAEDWVSDDGTNHSKWESLKTDLTKLKQSLSAASWPETLVCYIDAMQRFFTSDATRGNNAWPGTPIIMGDDDGMTSEDEMESDMPSGYGAYIGPLQCSLNRGYNKLQRHDSWYLSADELIAALRALTDDIFAMKPSLSKEIEERDQKLFDLLKHKKAAESQFRKIRFAYEGPKCPRNRSKKPEEGSVVIESEKSVFKPTATKMEFEVANKARDKALEQYNKGLKNLVHRTQPVGFDKNHNAVYFFHHDPESLYVETNKAQNDPFNEIKTWHCIDSKPLFECFVSSLDVRGIRENALYDQLVGESGSSSLKRNLYDSNLKETIIAAYQRQQAEIERRLDNAMIKSAESTRRSGRLANTSKDEVSKIQDEIEQAKVDYEAQLLDLETVDDYSFLTGSQLVSEFEKSHGIVDSCSLQYHDAEAKPGVIGNLGGDLLRLEEICDGLAPWDNTSMSREEWRRIILDTSEAWRNGCTMQLGPKEKDEDSLTTSPTKRQRMSIDSVSGPNTPKGPSLSFDHVLSTFKGPLMDLEQRIYSITGVERATKEVDEANDNITVVSNDSDRGKVEVQRLERAHYAWKRKIYSLHFITPRRAGPIRDVLVSAIAIARKGNLTGVLEDLRNCLKIHRPGAGGRARTAALDLLKKYGFELRDDDEEEVEDDEESMSEVGSIQDGTNETEEQEATFLSSEAMMLSGCLEGDDQADRVDWKDAVATCKTVSRFAALVAALKFRAAPSLEKLVKDKKTLSKAILHWEASSKTRKKSKKSKNAPKKYGSGTEIWANISLTDEFVVCKVEGFPWWPARVCDAKDSDVSQSLESVERVLVSFVGEQHLYVVEKNEVKPFNDGSLNDENTNFSSEVIKNVSTGITMAKRIMRGKGIIWEDLTGMSIEDAPHAEEKKSSC